MSSWRDETPQQIQDDLDQLVGVALDAAQTFLEKNSEFYPFAVTLSEDGVGLAAGHDESMGDRANSSDLLDLIVAGLRAGRDRYRAAAVVAPVVASGADAVRVEAEHSDGGPAVVVLLPYHVSRFRKRIEFGDASAGGGVRQVWGSDLG